MPPMPAWMENWLARHRHPASRLLHAVGIPLIPLAGYLVVAQLVDGDWGRFWRPVGLLVVSYALQGVGHLIEGNDMGELILIKKLLGPPCVAVAPRYRVERSPSAVDDAMNPVLRSVPKGD